MYSAEKADHGFAATDYSSTDEVGLLLRNGGHKHAPIAKHGSVAVTLGIDLGAVAQVDVDVPGPRYGLRH